VQKRIYGIETEYGIIFTPEGRKTLPVEKAIRFLFEKLITTEHFLNVFLENGARFYQDTGCHPDRDPVRAERRSAKPDDRLHAIDLRQ
jgi:proteasome accessory factor A